MSAEDKGKKSMEDSTEEVVPTPPEAEQAETGDTPTPSDLNTEPFEPPAGAVLYDPEPSVDEFLGGTPEEEPFEPPQRAGDIDPPAAPSSALDRKFTFVALSASGKEYTEYDAIIFLGRDPALKEVLSKYHATCLELGCGEGHMAGLEALYSRVSAFQALNGTKLPGVEGKDEREKLTDSDYEPVVRKG